MFEMCLRMLVVLFGFIGCLTGLLFALLLPFAVCLLLRLCFGGLVCRFGFAFYSSLFIFIVCGLVCILLW